MHRVFELARLGTPSPNPYVGCVIVKDGCVIGEGFHHRVGEAHAEIEALRDCELKGNNPTGATLYVNLEPCSHHGRTPPCVDALIKAGILRVVISTTDPNPLVNGQGIEKLRSCGIEVIVGVLEDEGKELNKHFLTFITQKRPFVYLKAALTLDGKIACSNYDSKWISGDESRMLVHELRSKVDAVLVGKNTIVHDNPQLNARLDTVSYPVRIVLDSNNSLRVDSLRDDFVVFHEEGETLVLTTMTKEGTKNNKIGKNKIENNKIENNKIVCKADEKGRVNLHDALSKLAARGITSLLIEGGSSVFSSFIQERLVDELWLFIAPTLLGDENAIPLLKGFSPTSIKEGVQLRFTSFEKRGEDIFVKAVLV